MRGIQWNIKVLVYCCFPLCANSWSSTFVPGTRCGNSNPDHTYFERFDLSILLPSSQRTKLISTKLVLFLSSDSTPESSASDANVWVFHAPFSSPLTFYSSIVSTCSLSCQLKQSSRCTPIGWRSTDQRRDCINRMHCRLFSLLLWTL